MSAHSGGADHLLWILRLPSLTQPGHRRATIDFQYGLLDGKMR